MEDTRKCKQIQHTLDDMHAREVLTDKAYEFLSPADCKPARFYHQPKLHKESVFVLSCHYAFDKGSARTEISSPLIL